MKTRSVKSSQVSAFGTVAGAAEGAQRRADERQAPRPKRAEIEPGGAGTGPPLIANVSGRLAGSSPSFKKAT